MCPILVFLCWRVSWYMRIIHIIYHVYHVLLPDNINLASTNYIVLNSTDKACKLLYFIGNKTWPLHTLPFYLLPPLGLFITPLLTPPPSLLYPYPYFSSLSFYHSLLYPYPYSPFPFFTPLFFSLTLTPPPSHLHPSLLYPYPYFPSFPSLSLSLLPLLLFFTLLFTPQLLPFFTLNFTPPPSFLYP